MWNKRWEIMYSIQGLQACQNQQVIYDNSNQIEIRHKASTCVLYNSLGEILMDTYHKFFPTDKSFSWTFSTNSSSKEHDILWIRHQVFAIMSDWSNSNVL